MASVTKSAGVPRETGCARALVGRTTPRSEYRWLLQLAHFDPGTDDAERAAALHPLSRPCVVTRQGAQRGRGDRQPDRAAVHLGHEP